MPSFRINLQWAAISEVLPNLYISGVTALKPAELSALGVDLIVNCTCEIPNLNCMADCHRVKLWLEDEDGSDAFSHFDPVADQIEMVLSNRGKVLVHCVAGVSRSAAVVLAYLLKYRCRSLREAYWLLSARRPMVRPNLGFWRQLIAYEQLVKKSPATVRLVWVRTERRRRASGESVSSQCSNDEAGWDREPSSSSLASNAGGSGDAQSTAPAGSSPPSLSAAIAHGTVVGDDERRPPVDEEDMAGGTTEMTLVPDVYMPIIVPERKDSPSNDATAGCQPAFSENHPCCAGAAGALQQAECRERKSSGQKSRFVPILAPVHETVNETTNATAGVHRVDG